MTHLVDFASSYCNMLFLKILNLFFPCFVLVKLFQLNLIFTSNIPLSTKALKVLLKSLFFLEKLIFSKKSFLIQ